MAGLNISPVNVLSLTRSYQLITYLPTYTITIHLCTVSEGHNESCCKSIYR